MDVLSVDILQDDSHEIACDAEKGPFKQLIYFMPETAGLVMNLAVELSR